MLRRFLVPFARRLAVACVPTADTVKGPAYRRGAPFRDRLCGPEEPGEPLRVTGTVTGAASCASLPEAVLDVWQTDARGRYSNLLGLARRADPRRFHLRGRLRPDAQGRYRFVSVLPGHYPLWIFSRPRHVHFLVTCPGYQPLVTQLYFAGDPLLERDPWVEDSLIVEPQEELAVDGRRAWRAAFDIVLSPAQ
jgi:catechol 1,2-dioxygenase